MFEKLIRLVQKKYQGFLGLVMISPKTKKETQQKNTQKYGNDETIRKYWK
jgi:hypothetical protein